MVHWERLLAHRHWITLSAFGKEWHLCARCSGITLGFIGVRILISILVLGYSLPFHIGFILSLLFVLPSIFDWTTQDLGFRQSNNNLRLIVGFFEGIGVGFLSISAIPAFMKLLILTVIGLGVISVGIFRRLLQKSRP